MDIDEKLKWLVIKIATDCLEEEVDSYVKQIKQLVIDSLPDKESVTVCLDYNNKEYKSPVDWIKTGKNQALTEIKQIWEGK